MHPVERQLVLFALGIALFGACSANDATTSAAPAGAESADAAADPEASPSSSDAGPGATRDASRDGSTRAPDGGAPPNSSCDLTKPFSTYTPLLSVSTSVSQLHTGSETIRGAHVSADERSLLFVVNFSLVPEGVFTATRSSSTGPFGPRKAELGLDNGVEPEGPVWMANDALTAYASSQQAPGVDVYRIYRFTRTTTGGTWSGSLVPGLIDASSTDRLTTPFVVGNHVYFSRYANNGPVRLYEASLVGAPAPHPISELNLGTAATHPVLTPDELAIFWLDNHINQNRYDVWQADRQTTADPFSGARAAIDINNGRSFVPIGVSADACRLYVIGSPLTAGTGQDEEIAVLGR